METSTGRCCSLSQGFHAKFCSAEYVCCFSNSIEFCDLCYFRTKISRIMSFEVFILWRLLLFWNLFLQVGEFYEAIGIDACILVEYAGLNPFGGLRSDSIPKAGCPIMVHNPFWISSLLTLWAFMWFKFIICSYDKID